MSIYDAGNLISTLRKQKKLTQKQLSDGICSRDTLSRIERGERTPDFYIFDKLLLRLGQDSKRYYKTIVSNKEKFVADTLIVLNDMILTKKYEDALEKIKEIENLPLFKDGFNLQRILHSKSACIIGIYGSDAQKVKQAYDLEIKAIKITIPDFDEEKINTYAIGNEEMTLINTLAIIRSSTHGIEKATEIFLKLKKAYEANYIGDMESGVQSIYLALLSNICRNLRILGRFDESIAICDEGIMISKKFFSSYHLPKFTANKSSCLFSLALEGREECRQEAVTLFERACHLFMGHERFDELKGLKEDFKKRFGVEVDF